MGRELNGAGTGGGGVEWESNPPCPPSSRAGPRVERGEARETRSRFSFCFNICLSRRRKIGGVTRAFSAACRQVTLRSLRWTCCCEDRNDYIDLSHGIIGRISQTGAVASAERNWSIGFVALVAASSAYSS